MSVPAIRTLSRARVILGTLVDQVNDAASGPVLMGPYGLPRAVLVSWEVFDEARDALATLDVLQAVPELLERTRHPSGLATAAMSALLRRDDLPGQISFWPDAATDLRTVTSLEVAHALQGVTTGILTGQPVPDTRLGPGWAAFVVVDTSPDGRTSVHHVVWRQTDTGPELVAVLPASHIVTRTWQPAPEPQTADTDQDTDPGRGHRDTSGAKGPGLTAPRRVPR